MKEWSREDIGTIIETDEAAFLYVYTPLCGTCQLAGKMISVVSELFPELKWGKCNLNFFPEYALDWEVESVPCLIFFKNKKIQDKIYAFESVPFLYEKVRQMRKLG